ncbi:uncharacterized protein LOC143283663 isoform X2 [Babylonia areolata]|uniref:uncharacterized protein LOC143283663 isoform X2 n=1 Tax=Babylonia areolata TaxID=304850 RepID=UPI003FD03BBF
MSGGGALNLSLLSRGIGEVQKNGHEKVEVFLEPSDFKMNELGLPEDYFNFAADRPYYLPPIQPSYHFAETSPRNSMRSARDGAEIPLPKTFTTRKGALLLFSEDMALKTNEKEQLKKRARRHHPFQSASLGEQGGLNEDETAMVMKTVDDLAKSILQYGARQSYNDDDDKMYLKFIHRRREQWERQIRPGYSAKRYLSTWTKNWDDQVFETVVSKGYLTERSLFHYNLFLPHLRRHLFHEDLSNMPQPYRLMKNMLLTPGSLSGYTFFREPDFGGILEEEDEEGADGQMIRRPDTKRSIRVIRTSKEGLQKEISYSALDKDTQKEVITDLLVKSAVHYALSKQEEILEESLAQAAQSEHGGEGSETTYQMSVSRKTPADNKSVPNFDMRDAVDSLLDKQRGGAYVLGGDLPDVDARSHSSDHTGSFKGGSVPQHAVKSMGSRQTPRGSWPATAESGAVSKDKEFLGDVPVAALRDVSASSSHSSVPQLPPIGRHALSPIKDVSRETSQLVTLPPIHKDGQEGDMPTVQVMPPTPQQSNTKVLPAPRSDTRQTDLQKVVEAADAVAAEAGGHHMSSDSSPTGSTTALTQRTGHKSRAKGPKEDSPKGKVILFHPPERTSHLHSHNVFTSMPHHGHGWEHGRSVEGQGHRTGRSLAAGSVESKSMKGSMIMAPDGEIISVGGSVAPPRPADVGVISDVTPILRAVDVNMTDESGVSDDEPDEWRASSKMRKPRALSSKLSDSMKRSVGKREIDYTSGDIDATMSIHSWSYALKENEGEGGLVKTGSMRSLPGLSYDGASRQSSVTEQDILDTLTEHAKRIAESVLSNNQAGQDLEQDVRIAADLWMDSHPTRDISRSHSVQDTLKSGAIDQIMTTQQRASSAGPTTDEYKDLIRQSLTTAVAKAAGLDPEQLPEDAEISPDLLEALASQKLTPEDLTIFHDEETGRPIIKSRQEVTQQALGGVAEGHIYVAPNGKGGSLAGSEVGIKRQMSIPADRASLVDNMDYDVISYGGTEIMSERGRPTGKSKAGSKPGSIAGNTVADLKEHPAEPTKALGESSPDAEQDEFKQRLQQLEKDKGAGDGKSASLPGSIKEEDQAPVPPGGASPKLPQDLDKQSEKSAKTGVSQKTEKSDDSKKKKAKSPEEPFVVGLVDHKAELSKLYGAQGPGSLPSGKETKSPVKGKKPKKDTKKEKSAKKGGKGKKKGKKEDEATPELTEEQPPASPAPVEEPPPPPKEPTPAPTPEPPKPTTASSSEKPFLSSPELTRTDDEMEFTIIREESSPEPDPPQRLNLPPPFPEEDEEEEEEEEEQPLNDSEGNLKSISNREARAAKRAAAAAKRKEEVEKRRREREEQLKREKEELERQEQLKKEMETERKRREEERRLRKQQEAEEAMKEERAVEEAQRKKRLAEERERRAKEEYQRKLEEMRRKQIEEEAKRMELLLEKQREEEARRAEEELMMSQMAEQERIEYEKKRRAEEAERKRREEEERLKREEEARKALEEAKRLAEEMARKQVELEARLRFNRALQVEASGMDLSHDINRAFVFSYFELLQWLGLDIPEFELAKMGQQL